MLKPFRGLGTIGLLALLAAGCGSSGTSSLSGTTSGSSGPSGGNLGSGTLSRLGSVVVVQDGSLIKLDASGQNPVVLTRNFQDDDPAFSPDGRGVIFSRSNPGSQETADVFRVDIDGSGLVNLTPGFAQPALDPEYSRDGKLIVFSAEVNANQQDLYLMNADGSAIRQLTSGTTSDRHPSFSLDGSQVVFQRGNRISVVDVSSGAVIDLTDGSHVDTYPSYCPPGGMIVFTRDGEIWSITGQTLTQISHTPLEKEFQASHSVDPRVIFALASTTSGVSPKSDADSGDLYVMDQDGGNRFKLTDNLRGSNFTLGPGTPDNKNTFTLNLENKSDYPDSEVFINISGKNEALNAWFYLGKSTDPSLTRFDDTPGTLLKKKADGAFVGNDKYFIKMSDMVSVGNHTRTMEVPRDNLYSGRIYLSFGKSLPGVGITAPGYAFARDAGGAPIGDGTPVTGAATGSGQTDTAGNVITGLNIDATTLIYPGEPVSGSGIPAGTVVRSVASSSSITLSQSGPPNSAQTLTFTPPPFSNLSLQGPSFTGAPDYLIPFEFMELSATRDLTVSDPWYTLFVNTSVVDFFSIGLGMSVDFTDATNKTVGFQDGTRDALLAELNNLDTAHEGFKGFVLSDGAGGGSLSFSKTVADPTKILRVLGPQNIIQLNPADAFTNYLQPVIDAGWTEYASKALNIPDNLPGHNPYGFTYSAQTIAGGNLNMTCTNVSGSQSGLGENYKLPKPTTFIVFKCDDTNPPPDSYSNNGTDAHKRLASLLCAALNRGVFADYSKWSNNLAGNPTFYLPANGVFNVYAKLLHKYALLGKVYGFGYDDIYGQDPTIAGSIGLTKGSKVPPGGAGITRVTVKIPAFHRL